MTILANTAEHLVEFDTGFLSIARYSDGYALGLSGKGIAAQFRDCLAKCGAERTIAAYIRMGEASYRRASETRRRRGRPDHMLSYYDREIEQAWQPLYKAQCMPLRPVDVAAREG